MNTLTLISGQWMPSRLRFPLLFLLPLILLAPSLVPGKRFMPLLPVTQEPLASEYPASAQRASDNAQRVATDRSFPILTDELEIQRQALDGTLPTWDPKAGLGTPLAAGTLATPWNPLRWPFFLMDPATASGWHALLSMALAGLGLMMFLEGRGLKFTAAFLGAVAFQASGFMIVNLHYIMKVDALVWAPWCLWGVDLIYRGRKNAGLLLTVALGLSGVAGFPQVFVFVCALTLAWILARALEAIREPRECASWKQSLASALVFAGLGCAASAVQWVPMAELAQHSARTTQEPLDVRAQSLPLAALVTTILPLAFGLPTDAHSASEDAGLWYWLAEADAVKGLDANRLEWNLFAGLSALALALGALFSRPRQALFPLALALLAWGFVFNGPGLDFLYGLPGANIGAPSRAAALAALGVAWLAALGFDSLLEGRRAARVGTLLVGLLGAAFGAGLWWSTQPEQWAQELLARLAPLAGEAHAELLAIVQAGAVEAGERLAHDGLQLAVFGTGVVLLAYFAGRVTVRGGGVAGCLLLIVEASCAGLPQTTPSDNGGLPIFPRNDALDAVAEVAGQGRVVRLDTSDSGVDDVLQLARPNMLSPYGIRDLTPYQALPLRGQRELWQAFDPGGVYRSGVSRVSSEALLLHPLLDVMNVTCVLATHELQHPRLRLRYHTDAFYVHERVGALGQARIVPALINGGQETVRELTTASHDFRVSALAEFELTSTTDKPFQASVPSVSRPAANRIDVHVQDASAGYLVMHESWMPGWKATVNGKDARVLRLDHIFFGVALPPGESVVRFHYEPMSLRLGATLSIVALLIALGLTRRRQQGARPFQHALLPHAPANSR